MTIHHNSLHPCIDDIKGLVGWGGEGCFGVGMGVVGRGKLRRGGLGRGVEEG